MGFKAKISKSLDYYAGESELSPFFLKLDQTTPQDTTGCFQFDCVHLGTKSIVDNLRHAEISAIGGVISLASILNTNNHSLNIDLESDASWVKFTSDVDIDFDALALRTSKNIRVLNSAFFDGEKKFGYLGVGWLTGWTYRIKATFSASTSQIPSSSTNFPALITRSSHAHIKANALSTGNDLRVTMADGVTPLPIEKALYDSSTGGFDIWFKMPILNTSKIVYLYYGNSSATNVNSTEVWSNGWLGVWHLNEASGNALDSLGVYNGTATGASLVYQATGKFGKAITFPGSSAGYFDLGAVLNQDVPITLSAWHKTTSNNPMWSFSKSSDSSDTAQYAGLYYNTNRVPSVFANSKSVSTDNNLSALTTPASGAWAYIVATLTNGANGMKIYVDGDLSNQVAPSATIIRTTATGSFYIGRPGYNNHYWNGSLQEVRMSSVVRSADWIKTEYNMMNDNATFVTLGDPETVSESGYLGGFYDANTGRVGFGGIDELAKVQISPTTSTEIGLYQKSRSGFTGDLAEWATYLDVVNTKIDYQGILRANYIRPIADGTTALRVQNDAGTVNLINIDTSGTTSFNSSTSVSFNVISGTNAADGAYAQFIGQSEVAFNWFARENLAGKRSIRWISIDQMLRVDLLADDGGSILTNGIFNVSFSAAANSFHIDTTSRVGLGTASQGAKLHVLPNSATMIGAIIQGASGQSVNLLNIIDFSSNILIEVEPDGELNLKQDSKYLRFGAGLDMGIWYDGTVGKIDTSLIAASDLQIACGTDKTIVLTETVWDDIQFQISSGKVPAANFPDWVSFTTNTSIYAFDVNDYIDLGASEMAHWWKQGTTIKPHLHLTLNGANNSGSNQYVKFTVYIAYADVNEVWTETSQTAEYTIPTGTADKTHILLDMGDLTFANQLIGCQVKFRIKRIAATGGTEYPTHIFISQLGIHSEKDTIGSRQVAIK